MDRFNRPHNKQLVYLPTVVTFLRLAALPTHVFFFSTDQVVIADFVFLLAIFSDIADGFLARKLGVSSKFGASFDACIDFLFIGGTFLYFALAGLYPVWVLAIIVGMFAQFIATSKLTRLIFDPVGKYYGSLLYGAIGLTMLFPEQTSRNIITTAFVCVSVASLCSRLIYYLKQKTK